MDPIFLRDLLQRLLPRRFRSEDGKLELGGWTIAGAINETTGTVGILRIRTRRPRRYGNRAYQFDEGISYWRSLGEVATVAPLGCLPLAVLSRAMTLVENLIRQAPGLPANLAEENERAWRDMQMDLARLSSNSSHIIADRSGHYIHRDRPDLVLQAIRQMVAEVRCHGGARRRRNC